MTSKGLEGVEAFLFDVFGTVVDWQGSIVKGLVRKSIGYDIAKQFAMNEWRSGYYTLTSQVVSGQREFTDVDSILGELLDNLLGSLTYSEISKVYPTKEDRKHLSLIWHRLQGWPNSSEGISKLKATGVLVCTLSNGNVRLLADMAKSANLQWDVIFSGDLLNAYKPDPKMYLGAVKLLKLEPSQCAMVAAHYKDLQAARQCGLRCVYIKRSTEDVGLSDEECKVGTWDAEVNGIDQLANLVKLQGKM